MESKYLKSKEILQAQLTLDFISDTVIWITKDLQIFMVNEAACKSLGYLREELLKMKVVDIDMNYPNVKWMEDLDSLSDGGELAIESRLTRKNGETFPVDILANIAVLEEEQFVCTVIRDISEKKRAEENLRKSEKRYKDLFESANDAIFIMDGEKFIECNNRTLEIFGCQTNEDIIDRKPWEFSPKFQPDGFESYYKAKQFIIKAKQGQPQRFYWKHLRNDGSEFDAEVSLNKLETGGKEIYIQAIVRDISELVKATDALRTREDTVRALINATEDAALLIDPSYRILELNDTSARKFGKDRIELIGTFAFEHTPEELTALRRSMINKLLHTKKPLKFESEWNGKYFITNLYPLLQKDGEVIQIAVFEKDITENEIVLAALKESENKFHKAFINNPSSIHITSIPDGIFIDVNPMFEKTSGFNKNELIGKKATEFGLYIDESDRERLFKELQTNGRLQDFEISFRVRSGEIRLCRLFAEIIELQGQKHLLTITNDITERNRIESALLQSEEQNRIIIDNIPIGVWITKRSGETTFISSNAEKVYGYSPDEIYSGIAKPWYERIHEDDREMASKAFDDLFETGKKYDVEFRAKRKDGKWIWVHDTADLVKEIGEDMYACGVFSEITEKKRIEKALLESEEKYKNLAEYSNVGILHINPKGLPRYMNPAFCRMLDIEEHKEIGEDSVYKFFNKKSMNTIRKEHIKRRKGIASDYEVTLISKKGTERFVLVSEAPLMSENNKLEGMIGTYTDITHRKKAEDELRYSEERLKILFESAPDAIYLNDLKGNFIEGNKTAEKMMGYKREELIGKNMLNLKLIPKNQMGRVPKLLARNVLGYPTSPDEFTLKRKDGSSISVEIRSYPVKIRDEILVLGIARDITERKEVHRRILNAVIETEEKERTRFAQDLHDGLGPLLSTTKLYIKSLESIDDPEKREYAIDKSIEAIDEAIVSIKEIANDISPHILLNLGLVMAIRSLTDKINASGQIKVLMKVQLEQRVDINIETGLFRVVEELLHNTIKYAKAQHIKIRLEKVNDSLCLRYSDDGIGFDVEKAYNKHSGRGLENIKNRVRSLNGEIQYFSEIGKGMNVKIELTTPF